MANRKSHLTYDSEATPIDSPEKKGCKDRAWTGEKCDCDEPCRRSFWGNYWCYVDDYSRYCCKAKCDNPDQKPLLQDVGLDLFILITAKKKQATWGVAKIRNYCVYILRTLFGSRIVLSGEPSKSSQRTTKKKKKKKKNVQN